MFLAALDWTVYPPYRRGPTRRRLFVLRQSALRGWAYLEHEEAVVQPSNESQKTAPPPEESAAGRTVHIGGRTALLQIGLLIMNPTLFERVISSMSNLRHHPYSVSNSDRGGRRCVQRTEWRQKRGKRSNFFAMLLVSYACRLLPLVYLSGASGPPIIEENG
jgi:hypothetical protein